MDIRRVKRWQWACLGSAAGMLLAFTHVLATEDEMVGGEGFISQSVFEDVVTGCRSR